MSSIFAKLVLSFASILGLVSAPAYIQLNTASIVFDYKTGDSRPLYYLNVKNIGSQRERFDVSADVPWIFISHEGYDNVTSIHLESEGAVNFTLDVRPEMVIDGSHSGEISVKAVDVYDYSVIETKTVEITFNKNFVPIPSVTPTLSASTVVSTTPTVTTPLEPTATVSSLPLTGQAPATPTPSRLPLFSPTPKKPSKTSEVEPPKEVQPPKKPTVEVFPSRTRTFFVNWWQFLINFLF